MEDDPRMDPFRRGMTLIGLSVLLGFVWTSLLLGGGPDNDMFLLPGTIGFWAVVFLVLSGGGVILGIAIWLRGRKR